jgi:GMP synthase-like glutamine amidotransferase
MRSKTNKNKLIYKQLDTTIKQETMKKLNIHTFMHVPYEGLGCIADWIDKNNHAVSFTKFYEAFQLPPIDEIDWLIVMGGPMGVYQEELYPWLVEEKGYIRQAIERGKVVLGICLGSQLIAEVLGAKVYPNKQKEIGWMKVQRTVASKGMPILGNTKEVFKVFHWHGDTYDLPKGSIHLLESKVCKHQAFLYNEKVLGIQFHFEVMPGTVLRMVENGESELIESETVQSATTILNESKYFEANNHKMAQLLDHLSIG